MINIGFIKTNKLMSSEHALRILNEYNDMLKRDGKINRLAFYRNNILPLIPDYDQNSWYAFLKRVYKQNGSSRLPIKLPSEQQVEGTYAVNELQKTIVSNDQATQKGIAHALNLGAKFYERIWKKFEEDPDSLSQFEQRLVADSMFKAMKSQDSRIHAIGKIKEDSREEAKFERAFRNIGAMNE